MVAFFILISCQKSPTLYGKDLWKFVWQKVGVYFLSLGRKKEVITNATAHIPQSRPLHPHDMIKSQRLSLKLRNKLFQGYLKSVNRGNPSKPPQQGKPDRRQRPVSKHRSSRLSIFRDL
jgi:hypothetical protein